MSKSCRQAAASASAVAAALSHFFLFCAAYLHKSTKPFLSIYQHFLPTFLCLSLFVCCFCLQLIFSFRFCSDCAHLYATFSFHVCLTKAATLWAYVCVCVPGYGCVCVWVCWLHSAQHWVNTLAAAHAVYVVDVNTIASWQILLETFEFSKFGLASRLLFNNWMALQFAAFSWL